MYKFIGVNPDIGKGHFSIMINFSKLYTTYRPMVYRYLYFQCGDRHIAEELTQETFYQVYISIETFKGTSAISTWIIAISRRVYLKYLRENKYQGQGNSVCNDNCPADYLNIPASKQDMPEISWSIKEQQAELIEVLKLLPETYRSVIVLREIENRSFEEIAVAIEKSPAATRVILHRAKKQFRKLWEQQSNRE